MNCLALLQHPLCTEDGLGALDIVLGHVEPKQGFRRVAGGGETSNAPQITLGNGLEDAAGDALILRPCLVKEKFMYVFISTKEKFRYVLPPFQYIGDIVFRTNINA
jgi:hypothetical protein